MRSLRNLLLPALIVALSAGLLAACSKADANLPTVTVYKSPSCGCCTKWVGHLKQNGFKVKITNMPNVAPMKDRLGVPGGLGSCHTAVVDGYIVEGHVPADVIHRLLTERPDVTGIAVPGMPIGSPGMEGPNPQSYDIVAFTKDGQQHVYASR